MPPDDEEDQQDNGADEATEDDTPEEDPNAARIAELEAALAALTTENQALSEGLFYAQVAATDALVDPSGLPYSADLLNNPEALEAAIAALLLASPQLGKIKVAGDVDQDARDEVEPTAPGLLEIMKSLV